MTWKRQARWLITEGVNMPSSMLKAASIENGYLAKTFRIDIYISVGTSLFIAQLRQYREPIFED